MQACNVAPCRFASPVEVSSSSVVASVTATALFCKGPSPRFIVFKSKPRICFRRFAVDGFLFILKAPRSCMTVVNAFLGIYVCTGRVGHCLTDVGPYMMGDWYPRPHDPALYGYHGSCAPLYTRPPNEAASPRRSEAVRTTAKEPEIVEVVPTVGCRKYWPLAPTSVASVMVSLVCGRRVVLSAAANCCVTIWYRSMSMPSTSRHPSRFTYGTGLPTLPIHGRAEHFTLGWVVMHAIFEKKNDTEERLTLYARYIPLS